MTGIRLALAPPRATLTLDQPERRNVLDLAMITELRQAISTAVGDPTVRVVVLTATGSTFCAGADLRGAVAGAAGSFAGSAAGALGELLAELMDCPLPVIARVQGHVVGGGNGLIAAADLAVAADTATFAFPEVRLGVVPAVVAVACLPRMRPVDARELLLTGDRVSATRAAAAGLVQRVVPAEALDDVVDGWVDSLCRGGPSAMARTKHLLRVLPTLPRQEALGHAARASAEAFAGAEGAEGMAARLERRPPSWAPRATGPDPRG